MQFMNTSKAPQTMVAPDGERVEALPGQAVEISDAFIEKIRAGKGGGALAAQAMLDDLVPSTSREAKRARTEMELENRQAHAQAGLPPPPAPGEVKKK